MFLVRTVNFHEVFDQDLKSDQRGDVFFALISLLSGFFALFYCFLHRVKVCVLIFGLFFSFFTLRVWLWVSVILRTDYHVKHVFLTELDWISFHFSGQVFRQVFEKKKKRRLHLPWKGCKRDRSQLLPKDLIACSFSLSLFSFLWETGFGFSRSKIASNSVLLFISSGKGWREWEGLSAWIHTIFQTSLKK